MSSEPASLRPSELIVAELPFPRRWLALGAIGLLTSLLLTAAIAALGLRGVASADFQTSPTPRPTSLPFLAQIGGLARTPTPGVGSNVAPTLPMTEETGRSAPRPNGEAPVRAPSNSLPSAGSGGSAPPADPPAPGALLGDRGSLPPPPVSPASGLGYSGAAPAQTATPTATALPPPTYPPFLTPTAPTATPTALPVQVAAAPTATAVPTVVVDDPPTVSIGLSDRTVDPGDSVSVTVVGNDDRGLNLIIWEGTDTTDVALDREFRYTCDGRTRCSRTWTVTVNRPGIHTLTARAVDSAGQRGRTASIDLRVRNAPAPTDTPTPRPTATPRPANTSAPNPTAIPSPTGSATR